MAEVVNMPKLGFDMQEGQLINWLKQPGDEVKHGDVLAEIESDKATVQVESFIDGTLLQHLVQAGDWVPIGAPIAVVGKAGETVDPSALGIAGAAAAPAASSKSAEQVEEAASPKPGSTQAPAASPEPVGQTQSAPVREAGAASGRNGQTEGNGHVKASPLARKVAEDRGVDLSRVEGSGPGGRIVKADVEGFKEALAEAPAAPRQAPAAMPTAQVQQMEGDEITETPKMRKRIGQRMVESKTTVPHFYVTTTIDMAPALDLRKELNKRLEGQKEAGTKVSVNDMIIKAVAIALREFPNLNSAFNGDTIVRHRNINVGIAVALDNGLINVVSKNADRAPLAIMAQQNAEMIERARSGKIRPEDVEGETIAVSNLGPFDVDHFIAIINPPAAAIVAVGSAGQVPVVLEDGTLGVGWRMKATISADHRVTDGAEAAKFMQRVKEILEDPLRLLM
jgi:pyruvate dehydrogenase E2 component (dihydrolipoamide acetyltransferase)